MASAGRSLRRMVEHWLAPDLTKGLRVSQFRRSKSECYVCVEAISAGGPVAMFFFRHCDGTWCIFPPRPETPTMRVAELPSAGTTARSKEYVERGAWPAPTDDAS